MDRLLDLTATGPLYLGRPEIAGIVVEALDYGAEFLRQYELHAWVVMPNHVHILITPCVTLSKIIKSLKGITAKRANSVLGFTGTPFWQDESYDHEVLNDREFRRIATYIENNPVSAGLAASPEEFRFSSAGGTGASRADQGVCPT